MPASLSAGQPERRPSRTSQCWGIAATASGGWGLPMRYVHSPAHLAIPQDGRLRAAGAETLSLGAGAVSYRPIKSRNDAPGEPRPVTLSQPGPVCCVGDPE